MQLFLNEQDQDELLKLFDELDELTREPFARGQGARSTPSWPPTTASTVDELRPWHYHDPFFQESPADLRHQPGLGLSPMPTS